MTESLPSTKIVSEAHASEPRGDDDLRQRMSEVELALEVLVDVEATHDWLRPNDLCPDARRKDWCRHDRMKEVKANLQHISKLCRDGEAYRAERQSRAPPSPPGPDGLRTSAEAARKPRKPTLSYLAALASNPGVARVEMKPDGTVVIVTSTTEPAAPDNSWPLDEFRTKETKQ